MKFEIFVDYCYFDMWSVKPFGQKVGFQDFPAFPKREEAVDWCKENGATEVVMTQYRGITNDEIREKYQMSYNQARKIHGKAIHTCIVDEFPVWKK